MKIVSSGWSRAILVRPTQADRPVPPSTDRWALSGTPAKSGSRKAPSAVTTEWVRQAWRWRMTAPTGRASARDSTTRPTVRPSSGACRSQPPSSISSRMYGSTDW